MNNNSDYKLKPETRFAFGANWKRFLLCLNDDRINAAKKSLCTMLGSSSLDGKHFIDVGSGSGLFSLAARQLGAEVYSFDYDTKSVACTQEICDRYQHNSNHWAIEQGSVLDSGYITKLGTFDVVYSWGVLHHTGNMWQALENVLLLVKNNGQIFIAIYNDQGWLSKYWSMVKRIYNSGMAGRVAMISVHFPYLFGLRYLVRKLSGRLADERGMAIWYDMIDWLGGYPFEVAKPEDIVEYFIQRSFILEKLKTCGGRHGCNEFVFRKIDDNKNTSTVFE